MKVVADYFWKCFRDFSEWMLRPVLSAGLTNSCLWSGGRFSWHHAPRRKQELNEYA